MKTGLIYQPCGLGDILFLQKGAHYIQNELGYKVYWPVIHEFKWLKDYIPDFEFVSWGDDSNPVNGSTEPIPETCQFPHKDKYIHGAPSKMEPDLFFFQGFGDYQPIMKGKYDNLGLDWKDWRDYIHFNRNIEKEKELYYNVLGLKDDDEFVYVNRLWCTRPKLEFFPHIPADSQSYGGYKVVENQIIPGYSLFDWCMVFEKASAVFMIETAINYILESPQLFETMSKKPLYLWHRWGDWSQVRYLFNLPWRYQ